MPRLPLRLHAALPLVAFVFAAGVAAAQAPSRIDRERGHAMLRSVRDDIEKNYYDPSYHALDMKARFDAADARIESAASTDEMVAAVAQYVFELGDSHTVFLPPARTVAVDYGWEMTMVGDSCLVTRVDAGSDAQRQGLAPGDLVLAVNGNRPTRANFEQLAYLYQALRPQAGLRVVAQSPGAAPRQLDLAAKLTRRPPIMDLTGADGGTDLWRLLRSAERDAERWRSRYAELPQDVLVWRLPTFDDVDAIDDLLKRARGKQGIVLDLRGNGGGLIRTLVMLAGAFRPATAGGDHPIAAVHRRGETVAMNADGKGRDPLGAKLVVLVDSRSASAAEIFARTMQLEKRATVIGDRTAGAVLESRYYPHSLGTQYAVFYGASIATGSVVMPDGGQLEKHGLVPDELLLPTSADLAAKRDPVLARALAVLGVTITPQAAGVLLERR